MAWDSRERRGVYPNLRMLIENALQDKELLKDGMRGKNPRWLRAFDDRTGRIEDVRKLEVMGETKLSSDAMVRGDMALLFNQFPRSVLAQRLEEHPEIDAKKLRLLKSEGIETIGDFMLADTSLLLGLIDQEAVEEIHQVIDRAFSRHDQQGPLNASRN